MKPEIEIKRENDYCIYRCRNGRSFIFDVDDLDFFTHHICTVDGRGYVTIDRKKLLVSHLLLGVGADCIVDHINGNPFDNRKSNLRAVTATQNHWNYRKSKRNTTGFKGIYRDTKSDGYHARICENGRRHYLGLFPSAEDAARAYDEAARVYFGEYATLNFASSSEQSFDSQKRGA